MFARASSREHTPTVRFTTVRARIKGWVSRPSVCVYARVSRHMINNYYTSPHSNARAPINTYPRRVCVCVCVCDAPKDIAPPHLASTRARTHRHIVFVFTVAVRRRRRRRLHRRRSCRATISCATLHKHTPRPRLGAPIRLSSSFNTFID